MTEKISGYSRPSTETKSAGSQAAAKSERAASETSAPKQSAQSDAVSLTDTATRLKSIESRINELPDVDKQKVEDIRNLIQSGEYTIDSKLIAQRIVQLEQALI